MRRILILSGVIALLFTQTIMAQDNNQSISDELKKIWGADQSPSGMDMDGMYDTPVETNNTSFDDNVDDAPVDGGIGILLAAGLGYGANRLRRRRKK